MKVSDYVIMGYEVILLKASEIDFFDKSIFGESEASVAKYTELKEALMQDKELYSHVEGDSFRRELSWRWSCGTKGKIAMISLLFTTQGEPVVIILLGELAQELTSKEYKHMEGWVKNMKSRMRKAGINDFCAMKMLIGLQISSVFFADDSPKKILEHLKIMYSLLQDKHTLGTLKQITNGAFKGFMKYDDEDVCQFNKPSEAK